MFSFLTLLSFHRTHLKIENKKLKGNKEKLTNNYTYFPKALMFL